MAKPNPTSANAPSTFIAITPSNTVRLEGLRSLRATVAGNLVLRGVEPGAADVTIAVVANEWIPFGAGYVRAATTATVVGFA